MKQLFLIIAAFLMVGDAMAQCAANFTSTFAPSGNGVLNYTFINSSTATTSGSSQRVRALIDFGDGSFGQFFGTSQNHNYAGPGVYSVSLFLSVYDTFTNNVVCADTITSSLTVAYSPCPFRISSTKVNDSTYTFTATNPASTSGITYSWNFGDGNTATGSSVTHTYAKGTYSVSVTGAGSGCTYTNGVTQVVHWISGFECDSVKNGLSATVNARTVAFYPSVTINQSYGGLAWQYLYDYGDGTPVSGTSWHLYAATGTYNVKGYFLTLDSTTMSVICRDTVSISVSVTQQFSDISGNFDWDSVAANVSAMKVYLIKYHGASGMLSAVDSLNLSSGSIWWRAFTFQNVPADTYLVKAVVTSQTIGSAGLLPTYADSSLLWSTARQFVHNGVANTNWVHIKFRQGIVTSGPGFVGGSVALGANKGTASGAPGVSMILRDAANKPVAMTETDAQGSYSFADVPTGNYTVLPELLNFDAAASAPFSITASSVTVNGVSFIKDDTKMSIRAGDLSVGKAAVSLVSVSPNPARSSVRIVADSKAGSSLELRDLSGKTVHRASIAAGAVLNLDVRSFPAGLYFLHAGSGAPVKLIIE